MQFALLTLLLALFTYKFNEISRWIERLQTLVIPGVIEFNLQDIRGPAEGPPQQKWATYYRVSEVKVVGTKLDEKAKGTKKDSSEWVEIMATTFPGGLAGGYVGAASELRLIPENTPVLGVGECIRIATFGEASVKDGDICKAAVSVTSIQGNDAEENGSNTGAFLKKDAGEGDRIVVFDRFGRPILDVDYWILEEVPE